MKVGLIAPPWVAVPPPEYGGTELIVDVLARGLAAAGHDVVLFATGDSTCPVPIRFHLDRALGTASATLVAESSHVVEAYRALADCDVVHDHSLLGALYGPALVDVPVVATAHGPFVEDLQRLFSAIAARAAIVAISHHQRSTAPALAVEAVIHHGIDVERMPLGAGRGGYALFLGRMSPDKGVDRAIVACRAAGVPLVIAAKMWEPEEVAYFETVVQPLLHDGAEFVGQVGGEAKTELIGGASCLINPIRWAEPFGLVMVEALACGTPVVAFREGAAPEIVDHGSTGFIVDDEVSMVAALETVAGLERSRCRTSAMARFSSARMVGDHVALYERLIDRTRPVRRTKPGWGATARPLVPAVSVDVDQRLIIGTLGVG
ncbi:MAG: glycosyltransferase family 4 protein [Acidimicrobiia bacterium]